MVIYVGIDGTMEANVISERLRRSCGNAKPVEVPASSASASIPGCAVTVAPVRTLPPGFAALDVPDDLADFATAAGGDEGAGNGAHDPHERPDTTRRRVNRNRRRQSRRHPARAAHLRGEGDPDPDGGTGTPPG